MAGVEASARAAEEPEMGNKVAPAAMAKEAGGAGSSKWASPAKTRIPPKSEQKTKILRRPAGSSDKPRPRMPSK